MEKENNKNLSAQRVAIVPNCVAHSFDGNVHGIIDHQTAASTALHSSRAWYGNNRVQNQLLHLLILQKKMLKYHNNQLMVPFLPLE